VRSQRNPGPWNPHQGVTRDTLRPFDDVLADFAARTGRPLGNRITEAEAFHSIDGHPNNVARFIQAIAPFAPEYISTHTDLGELVTRYQIDVDGVRINVEIRSS